MGQEEVKLEHDSKLPIWTLSPREEKQARQNLKAFTYKECNQWVKAMADCAKANGIKVFPACDPERNKMKECFLFYQMDHKYLDEQRDLVILEKINRLESQLKEQTK